MTALAAALKKSGYDIARDEIYMAAVTVLRAHDCNLGLAITYLRSVLADMKNAGVQITIEGHTSLGARDDDEGVHEKVGTQPNIEMAPSSPSLDRSGAVHSFHDGQPEVGRPAPTPTPHRPAPTPPRGPEAMDQATKVMKISRFDSHRLTHGEAVGDISYAQAKRLIPRLSRDNWLLRQLVDHAIPPSNTMKFREYISEEFLERAIQKAAELDDAA